MNFKTGYKELQGLQKEITELKQKIEGLSFLNFLKKMLLQDKLNEAAKRHKKLKKELFIELDEHLKTEMSLFSDTLKENQFLLSKTDFTMQVHTINTNFIGTTELKFTGAISPKGYLYLDVKKTNLMASVITTMQMSKSFSGVFDEYGSYSADSSKMKYNLILPRIPKNFVARGFDDFSFKMDAVETEWEIDSKNHIERLIGDPFHSNKSDRQKFLKNRESLLKMKVNFLNGIE